MSLFGALGISGSGVDAAQSWLNTTASNIANANDTTSTASTVYAPEAPFFTPINTSGQAGNAVEVSSVQYGSNLGLIQSDPTNPLADSSGNVRVTDVSVSEQLTNLISAQNLYEANTNALAQAKEVYSSALTIGR